MKTLTKTLLLIGVCGGLSVAAMQFSAPPRLAPLSPSTVRASPQSPPSHPVPGGTGHFHHHHPVVIFSGGFWWGYPYPYYYGYYGYPAYYSYGESFEKVGKQWGKDLKHARVTMDQFVTFLRMDVVGASEVARSYFQIGFLKGYGKNGLTVFTQALSQAHENLTPPSTAPQPPPAIQLPAEKPAGKPPLTSPKYQ